MFRRGSNSKTRPYSIRTKKLSRYIKKKSPRFRDCQRYTVFISSAILMSIILRISDSELDPLITSNFFKKKIFTKRNSRYNEPCKVPNLPEFHTQVRLDSSSKFLLPIVKWGPNNQLIGFFESIQLSSFLDRKIVAPYWNKHQSDNQSHLDKKVSVPSQIRINEMHIPNLVTLDDYKTFCGSSADAVFIPTDIFDSNLQHKVREWEQNTGIKILTKNGNNFIDEIVQFPSLDEIRFAAKNKSDNCGDTSCLVKNNWQNIFAKADDKKCVIFIMPFRSISNVPHFKRVTKSEVFDFSPMIRELHYEFTSIYTDIKLGVHWRFNRNDWSKRCGSTFDQASVPVECTLINKLNTTKLVQNLLDYSNSGTVYVAAPISEWKKISELAVIARTQFNYRIIYGKMLQEVLWSGYQECKWFSDWNGEVLSLVEQAIMRAAEDFIYWPSSSWSGRVRDLRKMFKMDKIGDTTSISLLEQSCE